jgi:hypothetical protein
MPSASGSKMFKTTTVFSEIVDPLYEEHYLMDDRQISVQAQCWSRLAPTASKLLDVFFSCQSIE